jgi:hypothetical protein
MSLKELIDTCKAEAIAYKLYPNALSEWRWFCRQYSKLFNTALHIVETMDPEHVILHIYEEQLEEVDAVEHIDELMRKIYAIEDPEFEKLQEDDLQNFVKMAEEEEKERLASGRPVHKQELDEPSLLPKSVPKPKTFKELPKEGFLNLSHLENSDDER